MANSEYLRDLIMQRTFLDSEAFSDLYVGLHTADPGEIGESELEDYERQQIYFHTNHPGMVTNRNALQFDNMPGATVTHFSVWDEHGHYLTGGPLDIGLVIPEGRSVRWREGELNLTIG